MMKLRPEARARVSALIGKLTYELAVWKREDHDRILRQTTTSNPRFTELSEHYSEVIKRGSAGIINAHIEGYRMDESLMDDDDENEILAQIKTMIDSNHHHIFNSETNRDFRHPVTGERIPNIDHQLRGRFDELYGAAAVNLRVAKTDLVMEQKKKPEGSSYHLTVHGDLTGGAQVGPNNVQNIHSGIKYKHSKPHIRWTQLTPEVGLQRVSEVGDVDVTEENVRHALEIGGDPCRAAGNRYLWNQSQEIRSWFFHAGLVPLIRHG